MRQLVLLLAVVVALGGCVRHPAISAAVAGGTIGFAACEIDSVPTGTCGVVGAITALGLGGIAWLVTTIFDTEDHGITFADDDELTPTGGVKVHTQTAPPPVVLDAGLADAALDAAAAPVADAAVADAAVAD